MSNRHFPASTIILSLIVGWKALLLFGFALPPTSNDSFFYDGPVVNLLLHGRYVNPSLVAALPISGTEVFSAYPPLYQLLLAGWMTLFGTSAYAAMSLHFVLFVLYVVVLQKLFRELATPSAAVGVAALFLLGITFHDRPDSLAHLLGILAVYACVRAWRGRSPDAAMSPSVRWAWWSLMAGFAVASVATGLQIGAFYILVLWCAAVLRWRLTGNPTPLWSLAATILVPAALIALVIAGFPQLWKGFLEHANQTPSFTGFRFPGIEEVLKALRSVPGTLAAAGLSLLAIRSMRPVARGAAETLLIACLLPSLLLILGSLFILTPNAVTFALYLQPLVVALFLAVVAPRLVGFLKERPLRLLMIALAVLVSIRAIGLSTWGIACSLDFGYARAMELVRQELASCKAGSTAVLSSGYLYEGARYDQVRQIHSDWMTPSERARRNTDWEGLLQLKPEVIVLTPFDYYRRYESLIAQLRTQPELASAEVTFSYRLAPPDASKTLQRVVQHISWAPVIIHVQWK